MNYLALALFCTVAVVAAAQAPERTFDVSQAPGGRYEIDKDHAYIHFRYSHMGLSEPLLEFDEFSSFLNLDPEDLENSSVEVTIQADSIDANSDYFDDELKSEQYFDVANFPEIKFVSTSLTRDSETTGRLTGELTVKDVTRSITLDVTFAGSAPSFFSGRNVFGFNAESVIKRSDWGLTEWIPLVSDEVTLIITAEYEKTE